MRELRFGTGGTPHSTPRPGSEAGIRRIKELGLGAMELEFVRRVSMGEKTARRVEKVARELDVALSVHGPYAINLNSAEADKVEASRQRILAAARAGWLCGARSIVFHAAFYGSDSPARVYERVKAHLTELTEQLRQEGIDVLLRPETTGKHSQFGSLEEIIALSREVRGVAPCIDFAHIHARTGNCNSYRDFAFILATVKRELGEEALENAHIHVSGIAYGRGGEREHLNLQESDFRYQELLQALKDFDVKGLVICESPNLEEDALLLQNTYLAL